LHTVVDPNQKSVVRPRRPARKGLLILLILLAALIGGTFYPPAFLFAVRQVLAFEAWRYGFHLSIGEMGGSVTDPIWLYHVRFTHNSEAGTSTLLEIDKAHTSFMWRHFIWGRDARVWHDLSLDGVRGTIDLPAEDRAPARSSGSLLHPRASGKTPRLILPASLTLSHASVAIRHSEGSVRLDDIDLEANDLESGHLFIGALSVQEPWMTSVFSNCRGSLLLEDSKLMLANMKLTDSLTIASASADLPELLRGHLEMEFALNAFSGNIQGDLRSGAREEHLVFESSGTFSNISVAQLGAFFGQDADGTINEGKFTFHGSPRELTKATFTTYFKAGDFRWGARQWKTLVAGATYVHHRLTKLDIELRQTHNSLTLSGDMSVPNNWKEWWKTDFSFAVAAQIDDLSELSALLGPAFGDTFGKLRVDGSVRGENASFNGQLIASGSHLSFRKAPLDELQAAIKLQGNEIQVTNAEFTHGDDFLRAHGVVNILGQKRYWGEVKANIADLALYASFLQPPIAPEAFGGGLMLDWSGDGDAAAHSGAFTVRLNRIHPLVSGSDADAWQPIDLTAEATYSPDSIFFSNLVLGNGATTLASRVVATPRALTLQNLKLTHGKATWLTGDAQAPLNVWAAWENPATASWWNFESPCKVDLKFDRFSVRDTLALSGHHQPFDGEVTGTLKTDGTLSKLTANGHLVIKNAGAAMRTGTLTAAGGTLDFKGNQLTISSGAGNWNARPWTVSGSVTASDIRKPAMDLFVKDPWLDLALGPDMRAAAALDLHATGQPEALALSGSAQLVEFAINHKPTIADILAPHGIGLRVSLPIPVLPAPSAWKLDIRAAGSAPIVIARKEANTSVDRPALLPIGTVMPSLLLSGSNGAPILSGSINVQDITLIDDSAKLTIQNGTFFLNPADPAKTSLSLHATGTIGGNAIDGYILGTLADKRTTWAKAATAQLTAPADPSSLATLSAVTISLDLGAPSSQGSQAAGSVLGFDAMTTLTLARP